MKTFLQLLILAGVAAILYIITLWLLIWLGGGPLGVS